MIFFPLSKTRPETLLHMAVSFGPNSGGRTKAVFQRSATISNRWPDQCIITLNHRMEYRTIFESWAKRHKLPSSVRMRNMFEEIAGETLYLAADKLVTFNLPSRATPTKDPLRWMMIDAAQQRQFTLRDDGSLAHVKRWTSGLYDQLDRFDRASMLRVRETRKNDTLLHTEYYRSNGQPFIQVLAPTDRTGTTVRVFGGLYDTSGEHVDLEHLRKRWIASLCGQFENPIAFIDDRDADDLLTKNVWLEKTVPTIAIIHSSHLRSPYTNIKSVNDFNGRAIAQANRFSTMIFLTQEQLDDVKSVYECPNGQVIPHAVEGPKKRGRTAKSLQTFVLATRLVKLKQIDEVIQAFALLLVRFPKAKLHIWGTGEEERALKKLVKELCIGKNVKFKGYTKSPDRALRGAAASIMTSKYEGFSLALMEALSNGVPVICYRFRYGPNAMVRHGLNGYLVDSGNVEALADAMAKILIRPIRSRFMGLCARTIRLTNSRRRIGRRWEQVILSVTDKRDCATSDSHRSN